MSSAYFFTDNTFQSNSAFYALALIVEGATEKVLRHVSQFTTKNLFSSTKLSFLNTAERLK